MTSTSDISSPTNNTTSAANVTSVSPTTTNTNLDNNTTSSSPMTPQPLPSLTPQELQLVKDEYDGFIGINQNIHNNHAPKKYYYYCDRKRQWKMYTSNFGYGLLQQLLFQNQKVLRLCCRRIKMQKGENVDLRAEITRGKQIYGEKKSYMQAKKKRRLLSQQQEGQASGGASSSASNDSSSTNTTSSTPKPATWSEEEYKHQGFQYEYLKLKSLQRFTENYNLLERCWNEGLFREYAPERHRGRVDTDAASQKEPKTLRIVSLGGGPGFELFAFKLFAERHLAKNVKLELISLDLEGAWKEYAELLGNKFQLWDVNKDGMHVEKETGAPADFIMLSYVVYHYMNEMKHAEQFRDLLEKEGTKALLVNTRVQTLNSVDHMRKLNVPVRHLINQQGARDDRQVVYLNSSFDPKPLEENEGPLDPLSFPNVPYEEFKGPRKNRGRNEMSRAPNPRYRGPPSYQPYRNPNGYMPSYQPGYPPPSYGGPPPPHPPHNYQYSYYPPPHGGPPPHPYPTQKRNRDGNFR